MKAIVLCFVALYVGAFAAPSNNASARVIGGYEAIRGQFPYLVSVRLCIGANCQHVCGGAIIDPLWILTAAHCVTEATAPGRYEIVAGILNLDDRNPERQVVGVKYGFIHPEYQGGISPYDLIVFRLDTALNFTSQVYGIMLAEEDLIMHNDVVTAGWGSIGGVDEPIMPNTIHYARTPIVPAEECRTALDAVLQNQPHPLHDEANLCTGPLTGGVAICTGDSGGPIVDLKATRLIAIASWTVIPCGRVGAPSVHNQISYFHRWIKDAISE